MRRLLPAMLLAALAAAPPSAAAQAAGDTVVVAGPEYRASAFKRFLLGSDYRHLWTAPVRVPVLDLGAYAGGLTPTEAGGGNQTRSLRFRGADGGEYRFRSVAKTPGRETGDRGPAQFLLQDQVSAQLPAAPLMASRLMDATGALHVDAELFVLPDDPRLGAFREDFAGMLGTLERHPEEPFAGSEDVEGTEDFLEAWEDDPAHRVADREYLAVRLMDLVLGDWDRHEDQYRWAAYDSGGGTLWRPVARDRDYAFVNYDGLLLNLARGFLPRAVRFTPDYGRDVYGLIQQGQYLDRRLLAGLDRAAWDSVTAALRARLTDDLIADAVARLPDGWRALEGAEMAADLRARRDALPAAAAQYYGMMASEPEAHASDQDDVVVVERFPGGMEVRIHAGDEGRAPYFRRRFDAAETREVRIYLHGGDDRAVVRGEGGMLVRVLGGGGDDRLVDQGTGARTVFYDEEGENEFVRGRHTVVDTRSYTPPGYVRGRDAQPPQDWGSSSASLAPFVTWRPHADLVVGAGPVDTRFGFRRHPFAEETWARALWAPLYSRFGAEARYTRRWTGSRGLGTVFARASDLEAVAFHGFGNQSPEAPGRRDWIVWERQLLLEPALAIPLSRSFTLGVAGVARYTDPDTEGGTPAATVGGLGLDNPFGALGGRVAAAWDRRDDRAFPRLGFTLSAEGSVFPVVSEGFPPDSMGEGFQRASALATAYLPLGPAVLALRAGGARAWGEFPVQYAAFVGGSPSLRGYPLHRFAGDAAAFGGAEARVPLRLFGIRGGALALADAGRVWVDGDSPGDWHTAFGGGLYALLEGRPVSLLYAHGERGIFYLRLGLSH